MCVSLCLELEGLESMDSNVSLSATAEDPPVLGQSQQQQPNRDLSASFSSSGSLPIRAPLTVDDDDDSDFESDGHKYDNSYTGSVSGSDSLSESETFVSGEESETASERQFVTDPVEETLEDGEKFKLSRPVVVAYLDEESSGSGVGDGEESGEVDGYQAAVEPDTADMLSMKQVIMPIAQLSMEEDDDSDLVSEGEVGSEVEDGSSLGAVKVPSFEFLKSISTAPRIKVLGVDQEEEDEVEEEEVVEDETMVNKDSFVLSKSVPAIQVEDDVQRELVENIGHVEPLGSNEKYVVEERTEHLELGNEERGVTYDGRERTREPVTSILSETSEPNSTESGVDGLEAEDNFKDVPDEPDSIDASGVRLDEGSNNENLESKMDIGVALDNSMATARLTIYNDIEMNQSQIDCDKSLSPNQTQETKYLDNGALTETSEGDRTEISVCTLTETSEGDRTEISVCTDSSSPKCIYSTAKVGVDHDFGAIDDGREGPVSDEDAEDIIFDSSEKTKQFISELGQSLVSSSLSGSEDHLQPIDGQIITESDELEIDGDGKGDKLLASASLLAFLKAATSIDESRSFTLEGSSELGPFPHFARPTSTLDESVDNISKEDKRKIEKIQLLRVKFLRLVHRLGLSTEDSTVSQVLYKLVIAAGKDSSQLCSTESAKRMALELEAESKTDLDFCLNILVLGKTGVGKSATINSIFGEKKVMVDAFGPATTTVKELVGTINGVKIRILDTPGLKSSAAEQSANRKILATIRKSIKKFPPDVVLYVDRLDTQTRSVNDLPLLRSVTKYLSPSIWTSSVVTLTHAASAVPDGPSGFPLCYEVFVAQRSRVIQQSISLASELHSMNPNVVQPVSLIENHPLHGKNNKRDRLVADGLSGPSQLLLLCYSLKVLSEGSSISSPQGPSNQQKAFGLQIRPLPLPYLLTSLLQSRAHPKLSADQGGNDIDSDIDLANVLGHDSENEDEYDQLPPFRPLRRSQIATLNKEQKKAYFEEYDYRVKLIEQKQRREEIKRLKEIKNRSKDGDDGDMEELGPETESVALLDMALPPSFDGDSPVYRYRFLEPTSQLLVRPIVDPNSWDHDCGYDGISINRNLAFAGQFPAVFSVQAIKDKKQFNIHWDSSVSMKHGESGSTMAGLDIQTVGKQLAYILRGETKVKNFKTNRTTAGLTVTLLGDHMATGLKIEDQIPVGKHLVVAGGAGVVRSGGDTAYGTNLELRLKEEDFPIRQDQSSLGLSLMKWRGDLALTAALQSQFSIGRSSKLAINVELNNKRSGQITIKTSSSDQLQMALAGILPIAVSIIRSFFPGFGAQNSTD